MVSCKYQSVPIPECLLEKWAWFWRCGHRAALRNLVLLSKVPRGHGDLVLGWVEMFSWRHFDALFWHWARVGNHSLWAKFSPFPVFLQPTHTQIGFFTFLKRFKKKNQREIFWSMLNFFEIQISVSINKVLTERGQVHLIAFCLWLLYYCHGSAGQLSPWCWPVELEVFTNWAIYTECCKMKRKLGQ